MISSTQLGFIELIFGTLFAIQNFAWFPIFTWMIAAVDAALNVGLIVLISFFIIEFYWLMILFENLSTERKIAIDLMGLIWIIGHDRVCVIRIIRVTCVDMMACVWLVYVTLLNCFELESIFALHNLIVHSEIISFEFTWFLECVPILKKVTSQFSKFNVGFHVVINAFGYTFWVFYRLCVVESRPCRNKLFALKWCDVMLIANVLSFFYAWFIKLDSSVN